MFFSLFHLKEKSVNNSFPQVILVENVTALKKKSSSDLLMQISMDILL